MTPWADTFNTTDTIRFGFTVWPRRPGVTYVVRVITPERETRDLITPLESPDGWVRAQTGVELPLDAERLGWDGMRTGGYRIDVLVESQLAACVEWYVR